MGSLDACHNGADLERLAVHTDIRLPCACVSPRTRALRHASPPREAKLASRLLAGRITRAFHSSFRCPASKRLVRFEVAGACLPARFPLYRRRQLFAFAVAICALAAAQQTRAASSERENVRKGMDALLSQPPLVGARASVEVVSLDDGAVVYSRGADDPLNPAS